MGWCLFWCGRCKLLMLIGLFLISIIFVILLCILKWLCWGRMWYVCCRGLYIISVDCLGKCFEYGFISLFIVGGGGGDFIVGLEGMGLFFRFGCWGWMLLLMIRSLFLLVMMLLMLEGRKFNVGLFIYLCGVLEISGVWLRKWLELKYMSLWLL